LTSTFLTVKVLVNEILWLTGNHLTVKEALSFY